MIMIMSWLYYYRPQVEERKGMLYLCVSISISRSICLSLLFYVYIYIYIYIYICICFYLYFSIPIIYVYSLLAAVNQRVEEREKNNYKTNNTYLKQ